jgi:hypothetical protein
MPTVVVGESAKSGNLCATHATYEEAQLQLKPIESVGGPGGVRTLDLMTVSLFKAIESKEDTTLNSAKSGKVQQNLQPSRNPTSPQNTTAEGFDTGDADSDEGGQ